MQFNSFAYLLFLPIVFLIYWCGIKRLHYRNLFIIAASYFFYASWNIKFLFLIIGVSLSAYFFGILIQQSQTARMRKLWLGCVIVISLGILFVFKYYDFFVQNFAQLINLFGFTANWATLNLVLPVGVSFYTFQAIGYALDIYFKKEQACRKIVPFLAFISFFPQLVAGPIERASNLLPQFERNRNFNYALGVDGMRQILWGLFKKMVVADNCGIAVDEIFNNFDSLSSLNLWIGALLFSFQIYCDFSGYSDIAIGTAKLFNIKLIENFKKPYLSINITEFWRRWHISLSSWLKDYVYIPLGGNRCSKIRNYRNTSAVFLLSGLWHGAQWSFIVWGGFHAFMVIGHNIYNRSKYIKSRLNDNQLKSRVYRLFSIFLTFGIVMIGWVIFRAENLAMMSRYISYMFSNSVPTDQVIGKFALFWVVILMILELCSYDNDHPFSFDVEKGIFSFRCVRWSIYLVVFLVCLCFAGNSEQFIYFQF